MLASPYILCVRGAGNYSARFYEALALGRIPVLVNTSFNIKGEPIVETPLDAIRTFYSCGLDELYIGNFRITKQ